MKRPSYRERDHDFGQAMLTVRTAMGLTQAELSARLGISRYAIGGWELGDKYPKAHHLKQFIAVALEQQAFPAGHEAAEIRSLWEQARQKVMLDEHWLASLLSDFAPLPEPTAPTLRPSSTPPRLDWGDALSAPNFYGREDELKLLTTWVAQEHCRVVSVVGFGGIGKSTLVVQLMHQLAGHFQVVIWRSLRDIPTYELLLDDCLHTLMPQPAEDLPASLEERQNLLMQMMRTTRTLLVLDNVESVLEKEASAGRLRADYENLGRVLHLAAGTEHQSCVLLTSREKLSDLVPHEGNQTPVRTLRLSQLDHTACNRLLAEKEVRGSDADKAKLTEVYEGNPLALKIVAQTIVELFDGEITLFLEQGEVIFGGVRQLLNDQFARLSPMEQDVLIWLAVLREPSTLMDLRSVLISPSATTAVLEAIDSLNRRSLIEQGHTRGSFTLQSVVLEYMTSRLIADISSAIEQSRLDGLVKYGLVLAHTREYVRQIETRLIAIPILEQLKSVYASQARLEDHLLALLKAMSAQAEEAQGYGPANVIVLLRLLRGNLRGIDLSNLVLRDLNLQDVDMQDSHLINARIENSLFTEAFAALTAVAVSSTGDYWAASSRRGEIRIWEAGGHVLHHSWQAHMSTVWALTFSPDGSVLASGCNDGSLKLWDVHTGKLRWMSRHAGDVNRLSFSPNGRVLAGAGDGDDCCVYLWHVANGHLLQIIPHPTSVAAVVWSPDGHLLASGDVEGYVRLWTIDSNKPAYHLQMMTQHADCADGLAFAPDGRLLASASWDGTVKLWDVTNGQLSRTLTGHANRVGRVTWSPDGRLIASSSVDETILLWDVEAGSYRPALRGHSSHVYDIAFTPDNRNLLSSSRDGSLRVWDMTSEQCIHVIHGYAASINDVDWSPDGSRLVSGGTDLVLNLWDAHTAAHLHGLQEHTGVVCAVGWSPDGRWLASSDAEYGIRLWDLTSDAGFRFLRQPDNSGNYLYGIAWSPDGQRLASGTHRHGVTIWDVRSGEEIWIGQHAAAWFPLVAFSPDGKRLAAGGDDGSVYLWNIAQNRLEQQFQGHHSRITSLAWSPDGTYLASGAKGTEEGELFVWDPQNGQRVHYFAGHDGVVTAIAWDANSRYLISGCGHGQLHWCDRHSGEQRWVRTAHAGAIRALRRSPDGTRLASGADDGVIIIWELDTGAQLQTLRRDRPYERLNITGIRGLTEAKKATLHALGAIEDAHT
ncbi:MAG: XRE family transcriptional regulator [Anaerolineaceae bacterium]|nr:XRE family transcriptional regulator [Anaerolineaceae bacterium]